MCVALFAALLRWLIAGRKIAAGQLNADDDDDVVSVSLVYLWRLLLQQLLLLVVVLLLLCCCFVAGWLGASIVRTCTHMSAAAADSGSFLWLLRPGRPFPSPPLLLYQPRSTAAQRLWFVAFLMRPCCTCCMWQCCTRYSTIGPGIASPTPPPPLSALRTHMAPLGLLAWPVFIFVGGIYARRVFWFSIFQLVFLSFSCCFFFLLCSLHAFSITLQHLLASSAEKGKRVKLHAWEILCTRMDKSREL